MKLSPRLKYAFAILGISICVRVNVISLLRIRLLFLSCCGEKLQGYVLPDLSCLYSLSQVMLKLSQRVMLIEIGSNPIFWFVVYASHFSPAVFNLSDCLQ